MLESKNKVYQNIIKNIDQSGGPVPIEVTSNTKEINERFAKTIDLATQWEQVFKKNLI